MNTFDKYFNDISYIFTPTEFKKYLTFAARFYNYSYLNTLLIYEQNPNATTVLGKGVWSKNFDREIINEEEPLKLVIPVIENSSVLFKEVPAYDVSQTIGEDIDTNNADYTSVLQSSIREVSKAPIIFINYENDPVFRRGEKGYYSPNDNKIVIRKGMNEQTTLATMLKQLVVSMYSEIDELEADAITYILCVRYGISTRDFSFITSITYRDKSIKEQRKLLKKIQKIAYDILFQLHPVVKEHIEQQENEDEGKFDYIEERFILLSFEEIELFNRLYSKPDLDYLTENLIKLEETANDKDLVDIMEDLVLRIGLFDEKDEEQLYNERINYKLADKVLGW